MNRRDILRAIALGGGVVAGELWIPGQRLISIPKPKMSWHGVPIVWDQSIDSVRGYVIYNGNTGEVITVGHGIPWDIST